MKRVMIRVLLSAVLTVITIEGVGTLKHLPYSITRDRITDALSLPGALIASVFYPEGVHTGSGAPNWGVVAAESNLGFYLLLWFIILSLLHFPRSKPESAG